MTSGISYVSADQGATPYHLSGDPRKGVYCGAEIAVDEDTFEYTENDIRTLGLALRVCDDCFSRHRAGGLIAAPPAPEVDELPWDGPEPGSGGSESCPICGEDSEDRDQFSQCADREACDGRAQARQIDDQPKVPAVIEQPSIPSPSLAVERARMELSAARDNHTRLMVRDQAQAAREAARILGLSEVQVEAAEVVALAERSLAKANPPTPPDRRSPGRQGNTVTPDNDIPDGISKGNLRQIRQAHDNLSDEQFEQVVAEAREKGKPLTRAALKRAAKKLNAPDDDAPQKPKKATRAQKLEAQIEALSLEVGTLKQEKSELQMRVDWFEAQQSDYDVDHYKRVNDQQAEIRTLQGRLNRLTNEREEARGQAKYWKEEAMRLGWKESRQSQQVGALA